MIVLRKTLRSKKQDLIDRHMLRSMHYRYYSPWCCIPMTL